MSANHHRHSRLSLSPRAGGQASDSSELWLATQQFMHATANRGTLNQGALTFLWYRFIELTDHVKTMYTESESMSTYLFLIVVAVYIALAVYVIESIVKLAIAWHHLVYSSNHPSEDSPSQADEENGVEINDSHSKLRPPLSTNTYVESDNNSPEHNNNNNNNNNRNKNHSNNNNSNLSNNNSDSELMARVASTNSFQLRSALKKSSRTSVEGSVDEVRVLSDGRQAMISRTPAKVSIISNMEKTFSDLPDTGHNLPEIENNILLDKFTTQPVSH